MTEREQFAVWSPGEPVRPVPDAELSEWFPRADRVVAKTVLPGATVSTVFLGINHAWGDGPDQWFETMVFHDDGSDETRRYATEAEARAGHASEVERLRKRMETTA